MSSIITLSHTDSRYPELLHHIAQPPHTLYIRGNIDALHHPHLLAVVGSRRNNTYGKRALQSLLPPIMHNGIWVVSGLAHGIDALSHRIAVEAHIPTIAVVGSGVDDASIYPRGNLHLAHQIIAKGGAIVSEYPPGTKAWNHHFPARNRIIAGLCKATLVVQAAQKSGSLITARLALESNRDVCAIPGDIFDPLCSGTNHLINQGALAVTQPNDIAQLYQLSISTINEKSISDLTDIQQQIMKHLHSTPQHIDTLVNLTHLPAESVSVTLMELEMEHLVEHVGGMRYTLKVSA